ncbi:hypothetical protein BKA62DRAFT_736486, partial [Auriculariales sp. MPI-PUGE-AT-0066]
ARGVVLQNFEFASLLIRLLAHGLCLPLDTLLLVPIVVLRVCRVINFAFGNRLVLRRCVFGDACHSAPSDCLRV